MIEAAAVLGIAAETANRLLKLQLDRIETLADELLATIESENARLVAERAELAATLGGEMRCLRAIVKLIIRDMVTRLNR